MKTKEIRSLFFIFALLLSNAAILSAADAPATETTALISKLIGAIEKSNFEAFSEDWGARFRANLKKEPFIATASAYAGRFHGGYQVSYLGDLKQGGCYVTLWKVSFNDQSDDALTTLVLKEGKVAGFWIK